MCYLLALKRVADASIVIASTRGCIGIMYKLTKVLLQRARV